MHAKRFFYVCAGLFLLALSYHLGARGARAESRTRPAPPTIAGFAVSEHPAYLYVMMSNGDIYQRSGVINGSSPERVGNFWTTYDENGKPVKE
jgi:hypothetical protein